MTHNPPQGGGIAPSPPCACLRTKGMYLPPNPKADGITPGGSSTAVYWCLKTMKMTGPDDGPVSSEVCGSGRTCYKVPV